MKSQRESNKAVVLKKIKVLIMFYLNGGCSGVNRWGASHGCQSACGHLVTEADSQLADRHRMRGVSSEEDLQLDGLVHVETGRLELGFALDCRREQVGTHCEM